MKNLVIDKAAIKSNLDAVKARARGVQIWADLTGDAFGLGLVATAKLLRQEGVRSFAVSDPRDARALRDAGFTEETLMMLRSTADEQELRELIDLNVVCTIGSYEAAVALNGIAEEHKTVVEVQIKIDTGLGRYGFIVSETDKIANIYRFMSNLAVVGVFSSYAQSWKSRKATLQQLEALKQVLDALHKQGFETGMAHICDSAALFAYDFDLLDAVRVGTAFSGRVAGKAAAGLTKVGYIEAGIEEVGWFPKGHRVGGLVLKKPARLAVVSVGYYHGFGMTRHEQGQSVWDMLRAWRRRPTVKLGNAKLRIVGEVGMTHTILDVTDVKCRVGDTVTMDVDPVNVKGLTRIYR